MINKIIFGALFLLTCISIVLPFQVYESMWANFDAGGLLDMEQPEDHTIKGYELIVPLMSIVFVAGSAVFSAFIQGQKTKLVGITFAVINMAFVIYLFKLLITPPTTLANSMFRPPQADIGLGFFLLFFTSVGLVIASSVRAAISTHNK